ncbi:hypothetical protein EM595_1828 [Duffyella gerundensis]|uniref:Uncharacterized protein n=1 Tax=Duffyella gerundensis TaxID=1619313 RepID=A0A0U5L0Z0_9GAMM|nr:hypothetical protein EM595_1828 [Duffyella gerundensis]
MPRRCGRVYPRSPQKETRWLRLLTKKNLASGDFFADLHQAISCIFDSEKG